MLKLRLTRIGKTNQARYRLVVAEHTAPVKGKFVEKIGSYNPESKEFVFDKEKIKKWLDNGAKPSNAVAKLLKKKGIEHPLIVVRKFYKKAKAKGEREKPQSEEVKSEIKPDMKEAESKKSAEESKEEKDE